MTEWVTVEKLPTKAERRREQNRRYREKLRIERGGEVPKRIMDENGNEILVYSSGVQKDASTGHIIKPPANGITSSERGRELVGIRHERVRDRTRKEILRLTKEAHPEADIKTEDDAYAVGAARVWKKTILNDKAYPRDQINALETIGRISDFIPRGNPPIDLPQGSGIQLFANLTGDDLLNIANALGKNHEEKQIEKEKNENVV